MLKNNLVITAYQWFLGGSLYSKSQTKDALLLASHISEVRIKRSYPHSLFLLSCSNWLAIFVLGEGMKKAALRLLYPKWESNPHSLRNTSLSRARLPVPPFGQMGDAKVRHGLQFCHGEVVGVMHKSERGEVARRA